MALRNRIYQPLPVYDSLDFTHYDGHCTSCGSHFIYDRHHLPSIVLERDTRFTTDPFTFDLLDLDGNVVFNVVTLYDPTVVLMQDADGNYYDQILINNPLTQSLPCGCFRLRITQGTDVWYTEQYQIIGIDQLTPEYNLLCFRNSCGLGNVAYEADTDFRFYIYLEDASKICSPAYEFEDRIIKNNLGTEKIKYKSMHKLYQLDTGLIPEFLVDAIGFMSLHDDMVIYPKDQLKSLNENCIEFLDVPSPQWDVTGCETNLRLSFQRDSNLVKTGCCDIVSFVCDPDLKYPTATVTPLAGYQAFIVQPIEAGYYSTIETSTDGVTYNTLGSFDSTVMNIGLTFTGTGGGGTVNYIFRIQVHNYNCDLGTASYTVNLNP